MISLFFFLSFCECFKDKSSIKESVFASLLDSAVLYNKYSVDFSHILANKVYNSTVSCYNSELSFFKCTFSGCKGQSGGAVSVFYAKLSISECFFDKNIAFSAGAVYSINSSHANINYSTFLNNGADYTGAIFVDFLEEGNKFHGFASNVSNNKASKWTGAMRVDRDGGKIEFFCFANNSASFCGCFFDFSYPPSHREIQKCIFTENRAESRGGAICAFHVRQSSQYENVVFFHNYPNSIAIESVEQRIFIDKCYFVDSKKDAIFDRFNESNIIDETAKYNAKIDDFTITLKEIEVIISENLAGKETNNSFESIQKQVLLENGVL